MICNIYFNSSSGTYFYRRRRKSTIPRYGAAGGQYSSDPAYNASHYPQGAPLDYEKSFQNDHQFYGCNDNRYYPTWNCHGNNAVPGSVTTGNAVPPQCLTETGILDPQRKSTGSRDRYTEHIYESPQFERKDHSFLPRESLDQTKYFELDPKVSSSVNNNDNRNMVEKDVNMAAKLSGLSSRYST